MIEVGQLLVVLACLVVGGVVFFRYVIPLVRLLFHISREYPIVMVVVMVVVVVIIMTQSHTKPFVEALNHGVRIEFSGGISR